MYMDLQNLGVTWYRNLEFWWYRVLTDLTFDTKNGHNFEQIMK